MMWSYIQLPDETQFAYSDPQTDGTIVIGVERPVDFGFDSARCVIPSYQWSDIEGFSQQEIESFDKLLRNNAPFIFELAHRPAEEKTIA